MCASRIAAIGFTVLALCAANAAGAVSINHIALAEDGGRYTVAFDVSINADAHTVRRLMTDYGSLGRLSHLVTESRELALLPDGRQQIALTLRGCVLFFCRSVHRVEDVTDEPNGDIVTRALPQLSDFSYAVERWQILPQPYGTRLKYGATLVPNFFIPPLIGPYIVKSTIRDELMEMARHLEILAGDHAPGAQS
ncbi:MAG: SRPBCC family protein [Acidiferrobacterales bacterium]